MIGIFFGNKFSSKQYFQVFEIQEDALTVSVNCVLERYPFVYFISLENDHIVFVEGDIFAN